MDSLGDAIRARNEMLEEAAAPGRKKKPPAASRPQFQAALPEPFNPRSVPGPTQQQLFAASRVMDARQAAHFQRQNNEIAAFNARRRQEEADWARQHAAAPRPNQMPVTAPPQGVPARPALAAPAVAPRSSGSAPALKVEPQQQDQQQQGQQQQERQPAMYGYHMPNIHQQGLNSYHRSIADTNQAIAEEMQSRVDQARDWDKMAHEREMASMAHAAEMQRLGAQQDMQRQEMSRRDAKNSALMRMAGFGPTLVNGKPVDAFSAIRTSLLG